MGTGRLGAEGPSGSVHVGSCIGQGDVGDEMYFIAHGIVDVYLHDGRHFPLNAGMFFGEVLLLSCSCSCSCSCSSSPALLLLLSCSCSCFSCSCSPLPLLSLSVCLYAVCLCLVSYRGLLSSSSFV